MNTTTNEAETIAIYIRSLKGRRAPGGDLFIQPWTRAEMLAPIAWHEKQLAKCYRFGVKADGSIGHEAVA